jgi:hypothetical protein
MEVTEWQYVAIWEMAHRLPVHGLDIVDHMKMGIMQHDDALIHPVSMHRLSMVLQRSQEGSVRLLCIDGNVWVLEHQQSVDSDKVKTSSM